VIQLIDPSQVSPETELIDFCRERLSHMKCPRSIDFAGMGHDDLACWRMPMR